MGKYVWIFAAVFGLAGLGMLIGSGWALGNTLQFRKVSGITEGVVVDFESSRDSKGKTTYRPVVDYTDTRGASHRITGSVGSSSRSYDQGDKVKVRFDREHPEEARIDSFMENWFLPLILGGMGLIFFGVGAGMTLKGIRTIRERKWLRANGMRVQAKYTGVAQDTSLAVNNRHPWVVNCEWQHPVTGATHKFCSDHRWYDPSGVIARESIDVVVNADDPKVYEVDIAFLPKKV